MTTTKKRTLPLSLFPVDTEVPHKRTKCIHGVIQYYCRECKGKGICEHGKIKSTCK